MRNDINILITLYLVGVLVSILQPVVGNPLHGEDSLRPVGDNPQPERGSLRPEGGSLRPEGGSRLLVEGKLQTEVGKHQVVEGMAQTEVGSRLPEVGIQGSSFLEHEAEAGHLRTIMVELWYNNIMYAAFWTCIYKLYTAHL